MEVSNEIKEDIRKTQCELKNAIRVHQVWVARLQDDENNSQLKYKVKEAEKNIIAVSQNQKLVLDRLRRELELYQQRLRLRHKQVTADSDNYFIAQQLRDYQFQIRNKNRPVSLLKPSVLSEIHIKSENNNRDVQVNDHSDSENDKFNEKENSNQSENDLQNHTSNNVHESRNNFTNALKKVKEALIANPEPRQREWALRQEGAPAETPEEPELSPTPSPPPLPRDGEPVSQDTFLRFLQLITPEQKEVLQKKRNERRKRATTSTNRKEFLYEHMEPKRRKYNQYPYLQPHLDPPQTRSAKLRKQQKNTEKASEKTSEKSSREASPSESSEGKWGKPAWLGSAAGIGAAAGLGAAAGIGAAAGLSAPPAARSQPPPGGRVCHGCGRNDVPSLLVQCAACGVQHHTGCGAGGRCAACRAPLPEPDLTPAATHYRDKLAERKRLQEKNIQLCVELRKLEARAATLKENLDEHQAEKRQLLARQIQTQRNLQKLLDFISHFKENSPSTSASDSSSELSKSNEE